MGFLYKLSPLKHLLSITDAKDLLRLLVYRVRTFNDNKMAIKFILC